MRRSTAPVGFVVKIVYLYIIMWNVSEFVPSHYYNHGLKKKKILIATKKRFVSELKEQKNHK